jgi:hypothetical protein
MDANRSSVAARGRWVCLGVLAAAMPVYLLSVPGSDADAPPKPPVRDDGMIEQGRKVFRFCTFGRKDFWRGDLRLHETVSGFWTRHKGGSFHDERFATRREIIDGYDGVFSLNLTTDEKEDLAQYLLSLPARFDGVCEKPEMRRGAAVGAGADWS